MKMLRGRKISQIYLYLWPQNAMKMHVIYQKPLTQSCNFYAAYCTASEATSLENSSSFVESPELPNWVKFCENGTPSMVELDDDFVLPNVARWADTKKLHDDHAKHVKHMVGEITDSDVNRLTEVLKGKLDSPEAICGALAVCDGIDLSESLVEKVLLRFSNDWTAAFGFFKWAKRQIGYMHSAGCYDMMVDILGRSGNFELMWALIEEMHKYEGLVSIGTMRKVMRRLSHAQKYDQAIETFKNLEQFGIAKDVSSMNILMDALVKERGVEHAEKVFLELKDRITPNLYTFNILIHGLCKARKYDEAKNVMEQIEKHGCSPNVITYTSFVEYYCAAKDFRKVDEIFEEMQQKCCLPNVITYTILVLALGKAKDINGAMEVWEKMKENGCAPDANFYSALIVTLSKSGRFKDACDLFNGMSKDNVTPNVLTYNTMITSACTHSNEEYALQLLQEMEEKYCRPNLQTYAPLLKMCCRKKRMKVLYYLLDDMLRKNVSIDMSTYSLLVNGLCMNGKLEHACSFFEQIVLKGRVPRDTIYKLLVKKLEENSMQKAKHQIEKLMSDAKLLSKSKEWPQDSLNEKICELKA